MNAFRPEAETEYSRGSRASEGARTGAGTRSRGTRERGGGGALLLLMVVGLAGAGLLIAAEFTTLLNVHSSAYHAGVIQRVTTGSHNSWALIPIGLLGAALAVAAYVSGSRTAAIALAVLGLVSLGIALIGDLPDTTTSGLLRHADGSYSSAATTAGIGLYLETLGAVLLLLAGGAGALLGLSPGRER